MAYYDERRHSRIESHVAERNRVLDMSLVRQVLTVGVVQKAAFWNAQEVSIHLVGYTDLLRRGM